MRIIVHDYAGHPFQAQLSRELARRGHDVLHAFAGGLVTPRGALTRQEGDPRTFRITEVPMSPDYARNKYSFIKRRGYEVGYGRELASLVARERPDLVLSANTPTEPQWSLIRQARASRVAVVTWVQDFYSIAVDKLARKKLPLVGALAGLWYRRLDSRCFRESHGIVVITDDFEPIMREFGADPSRITTIPNWAPLEELPERPRRNAWSARHGLDDAFVFQYSGTLAMKHNPDLLRRLAVRFQGDPAVRIVVISEGPGAEWLRQRKEAENLANLVLLPFQDFREMPEVLASADALVAILEPDAGIFSVPSKVLTYHCAGRPILASIPAENLAARIISGAGSGLCSDPSDPDGFVDGAVRLRAPGPSGTGMGVAARRYAGENFDIDAIAGRFEAVFARAMALR
jgi:glycosyltransferase involved in cell wall biosynthesis